MCVGFAAPGEVGPDRAPTRFFFLFSKFFFQIFFFKIFFSNIFFFNFFFKNFFFEFFFSIFFFLFWNFSKLNANAPTILATRGLKFRFRPWIMLNFRNPVENLNFEIFFENRYSLNLYERLRKLNHPGNIYYLLSYTRDTK